MPFRRGNISNAKVTPALVLKMRELYATGEYTHRDFCNMTGLSVAQVGKILRGEAWRQYQQVPHRDEILDSEARLQTAKPVEVPTDLQEKLLRELAGVAPPSDEVEAVDKFMQQRREAQANERPNVGSESAGGSASQDDVKAGGASADSSQEPETVQANSGDDGSTVSKPGTDGH